LAGEGLAVGVGELDVGGAVQVAEGGQAVEDFELVLVPGDREPGGGFVALGDVHHVVGRVEEGHGLGAEHVGALGEAGGLGEPLGDGGPAVEAAVAHGLAELFGETSWARKRRRARPVRFCSARVVLIGVLEGEGPQHLDPLAAGEDEEGRGGGHGGDVVAVVKERGLPGAIQMAEVQAIAGGDHQVWASKKAKAFSRRRSGWSAACSRRG
jgi:hypothetical protein